jgi:hypothetical protein
MFFYVPVAMTSGVTALALSSLSVKRKIPTIIRENAQYRKM